jgi:hypothetical protein
MLKLISILAMLFFLTCCDAHHKTTDKVKNFDKLLVPNDWQKLPEKN